MASDMRKAKVSEDDLGDRVKWKEGDREEEEEFRNFTVLDIFTMNILTKMLLLYSYHHQW